MRDEGQIRAYIVDLAKAERLIRPSVLRSMIDLRRFVLRWVETHGELPSVTDYLLGTGLVDDLGAGMAYAHMLGDNRTRIHASKLTVAFDVRSQIVGFFSRANATVVTFLKERYKSKAFEIVQGVGQYVDSVLRKNLTDSFVKALPIRDTIKNLAATLDGLGLQSTSPRLVETIARTNTQLAFQSGKSTAERDPDIASILWGYTYLTVGDDRVRDEHWLIDQVTLPKDDKFWDSNYPPNGWNCRCQVVPIFEAVPTIKPPTDYEGPHKDFNFNPADAFAGITD